LQDNPTGSVFRGRNPLSHASVPVGEIHPHTGHTQVKLFSYLSQQPEPARNDFIRDFSILVYLYCVSYPFMSSVYYNTDFFLYDTFFLIVYFPFDLLYSETNLIDFMDILEAVWDTILF
jgi:hypothetical protein